MTNEPLRDRARTDSGAPAGADRLRREAILLFLVALAARLAFLFLLASPEEARGKEPWDFGYEQACIGSSLARGEGFAGQWTRSRQPFDLGTGPTAWLTPVYPWLLALLFDLFGGVNPASATALFTIHALLAAATCVLLWRLGRAIGEPRAGRLAAWLFALYPASIWNAATKVWDTTLVAFALVAFLVLLFERWRGATVPRSIALGAAFGALVWVNPAPLSILPMVLVLLWIGREGLGARVAVCAAFSLSTFVVVLPWMIRNEHAVGAFSLRANLGIEMMAGNNDLADGYHQQKLHPGHEPELFLRFRQLGEVEYADWAMGEAKRWIAADPWRFVRLSIHRAKIFWIGDNPWEDPRLDHGMRAHEDPKSWVKWAQHGVAGLLCLVGGAWFALRSTAGRVLFGMLMLFPLAYYATHILERYRFPIEPLIVLVDAWLVLRVADAWRARRAARPA